MPKSCTMAKIRNRATTQLGMVCWMCRASKGFDPFHSPLTARGDEGEGRRAEHHHDDLGTAVPRKIQPTMDPCWRRAPRSGCSRCRTRSSPAREREGEGEARGEELPAAAESLEARLPCLKS
jgi:hypothetical protein